MRTVAKYVLVAAHIVCVLVLASFWTVAVIVGSVILGSSKAGFQYDASFIIPIQLIGFINLIAWALVVWKEFPLSFLEKTVCFCFPSLEEAIMAKRKSGKQQRKRQAALLLESRPAPRPWHPLSQLLYVIGVDHFITWDDRGSYMRQDVQTIDYEIARRKGKENPLLRLEHEVAPLDLQHPSVKGPDGILYIFLSAYENSREVCVKTRMEQYGKTCVENLSVHDILVRLGKIRETRR